MPSILEYTPPHATVSVVVPAHDSGRFIAEALDSILGQTRQVEQILIVDEGSTDDTEEVLARYSDRRIQHIKQSRSGRAPALNAGLDAARGDFITFLDAGDRWRPTFVETMSGFLVEDATVACVFANFVRPLQATGEVLKDQFQHYPQIKRPVLYKDVPHAHGRIPKDRAFGALVACREIPAYLQVMMFRRSSIENARFEPSLASGEDIHFALRTFLSGSVIFTDEVLAEVRRDHVEMAVHKLNALKALAPYVTTESDVAAYRDQLLRAHIDAAVYQTKLGQVRAGLRTYQETFGVPGSALRKFTGALRVAMTLPQGVAK